MLAVIVWMILNYKKDLFPREAATGKKPVQHKFTDILLSKQSWFVALYALLLWAPMSGFASLWGVPFLINVYHLSSSTAALVCSMMWLGLAVASPFLGWASTNFRSRVWPLALSAGMGAIAFAILLLFHVSAVGWLMVLIFVSGAACAGQALSFTVIKENNKPGQRATAIAFNNMAVVISGAIFQPVLGKLLEFHCGGEGSGLAMCQAHHYRTSMMLVLVVYVLAYVIAQFFIKESYGKEQGI